VARFFLYPEVVRGLPAPAPDILRVTGRIGELKAVQDGCAVVAGSAAWGSGSVRSDIDVLAYRCASSADLDKQIDAILTAYTKSTECRHDAPKVDITWIGAESEALIERDNLVSKSAPILEQHVVREIFERTSVRLVDHVRALAAVKGDPWRTFVEKYLRDVKADATLRHDILREYGNGMAAKWRQQSWTGPAQALLTREQLDQLGYTEGFAYHFARMLLGDLGVYPQPDRHEDVRGALATLGPPWGDDLRRVVAPLFALGDRCDVLIEAITRDAASFNEQAYYAALRESAVAVDINAVEGFMWRYLARG
jgi:hypothetical protein